MEPTHETISTRELLANAGFLRRVAHELIDDPHLAADLAQDTWVAALDHRPKPGPVRGWLATVARRLAWNRSRGDRRRTDREARVARPERIEAGELALERIETQRALFEEVLELSEVQRTVLYLRYYEGLTPPEIAARLDVPLKTVKTRHTRAVAAMRARLDARSHGDRRAWLSALLPLATPRVRVPLDPNGAQTAGQIAGGLMMKKWGIGATVALLLTAGWLGVRGAWLERPGGMRGNRMVAELETLPPPPAPELAEQLLLSRRRPARHEEQGVGTGALELQITWSDGSPAAAMGVELGCAGDPAPRAEARQARTDENGFVRITELFAGEVRIETPGRRFEDAARFLEAEVVAGETRVVNATLEAGIDVRGRVVDAKGAPVSGAQLWGGMRQNRQPVVRLLGQGAADGTFHLRALAPWCSIGARSREHQPSPCFRTEHLPLLQGSAADGGAARTALLELGPAGGNVSGVVLDPEGKPLAGARVNAGPRGGHNVTLASGASATAPQPATVLSSDDGTFILPGGLVPGVQPLHAQARGYPTWQGEVEVLAGRTSEVEIRLERGARVEGRVVNVQGQPVAGVLVRAAEEERGGWYWNAFPMSEGTSDENGWFVLEWLTPGERELNAHDSQRPDIGRARATVHCVAGETTTCELRLQTGSTIAGRVVDAHGQLLAGWGVRATPSSNWYPRHAKTGADGRFRLLNLGDCVHDLTVRAPDLGHPRARADGVPTGMEELEIVVTDAHVATGTVCGRMVSEAPLANLSLTLWQADGNEGHFQDFDPATGEFELQVVPGQYVLRVAHAHRTLATSERFEVREDESSDIGELRIEQAGELELIVRGPAPSELERMRPALDRAGHSTVNPELRESAFRVEAIAPGTWTLTTRSKSWHLPPTVDVAAGVRTTLILDAEPTVALQLEVRRADGGRVRELTLEARRPDGSLLRRDHRGYPESRASVTWRLHLPSGPVSIEVHEGELVGKGQVTLEAPFSSLEMTLERP